MKYQEFKIPKKSGGYRLISAPVPSLKSKQRQLLKKLSRDYKVSSTAHGFVKRRNILTNAQRHAGKKYILNMDIENFFPSCCPEMIELPDDIKKIVFHNNALPQGAPTSPLLSNKIMFTFDKQVVRKLRELISDDIVYTRYADDITLSSNSQALKKAVAIVKWQLSYKGFRLNNKKTRFMSSGKRQEVTGLNLNSGRPTIPKKYRKKVRAILHRASQTDMYLNKKTVEQIKGMIGHIALCHPNEAQKYMVQLSEVKKVQTYNS